MNHLEKKYLVDSFSTIEQILTDVIQHDVEKNYVDHKSSQW